MVIADSLLLHSKDILEDLVQPWSTILGLLLTVSLLPVVGGLQALVYRCAEMLHFTLTISFYFDIGEDNKLAFYFSVVVYVVFLAFLLR